MSQMQEALQVKEDNKEMLLAKPNVVGVGLGYRETFGRTTEEIAIKVLVKEKLPRVSLQRWAVVPREVDSLRTDVIAVGELRAQPARTERIRPAPGGVSIGHYKISAGTLGCIVIDRASGARLILSNNHVLANTNDARPGDPILQPGAVDGGVLGQDAIARLERFAPIQFGTEPPSCGSAETFITVFNWLLGRLGSRHRLLSYRVNPQATNLLDAALARPLDDSQVLNEILEVGVPSGTAVPTLGMRVRKSGRTTGLTTGEITVLDATVQVGYGAGRTASFEGQAVTSPMSQGGDSGSLVMDANSQAAVGLLFAGSDQSTIFTPIETVFTALQVSLP
ncbi:MAG TPA: hypothetical protein VLS48_07610 [Anaerolineales bacterium]|nr:hypothetical protein [Anaerolineales bacterium]